MEKHAGLTTQAAEALLQKTGPNLLPEQPPTGDVTLFIRQITSPLIYVLFFAAAASIYLHDYSDAIVIFAAVVINTILGFYQERKAERGLVALKRILTPHAKVIRDGKQSLVEARLLVPGDVVVIAPGDRVPADGNLVSAENLFINEAILTGESVAVRKIAVDQNTPQKITKVHQAFMGTSVTSGIGHFVITATGIQTEMGKIAQSLTVTDGGLTPLQKRLNGLARFLTILVLASSTLVFITGIISGREIKEMFLISISIAVSAIPEGLLVALTVILAIGMQRILKRKALVRRLVAAETLGTVTVIATDKTGTLTEGNLRVVKFDTPDKKELEEAVVLVNNLLDPLELALWNWAKKEGRDPQKMLENYETRHILPFDPNEKIAAAVYPQLTYVLGAPEVVLARSDASEAEKKRITELIESWAKSGLRLIAAGSLSTSSAEPYSLKTLQKIRWLGLVGFEDPVRISVKDALAQARTAGITIKIITGDYRHTAEAVLKKIGFTLEHPEKQIIEGDELEQLDDQQIQKRVTEVVLFSRVTPAQKLRIVDALRKNGEVVALVGDGVNDAPALKKSDIGIVVADATDVAKETADMVLLDSNFATIIAAIEEGRGMFDNLKKVIIYLLSDAFSEMVLIISTIVLSVTDRFTLPLPLTAAQILFINILSDGFPNLALTIDPKEKGLLKRHPISRNAPLLDQEMKTLIGIVSATTGIISLVLFLFALQQTRDVAFARTVAFAAMGINSLFYVFSIRNLRRPIWKDHIFSNPYLLLAVVAGLVIQVASLTVPQLRALLETSPLPLFWWGVILGATFVVVVVIEMIKWGYNYKR